MPPDLDIYGLTKLRDRVTLERFLDEYVDRSASENRRDEELRLEPLMPRKNATGVDAYDWEPSQTLTHIVERGLDYPRRAFTVYLKANRRDIDRAILRFTTDDQLVFGLSIDDADAKPENEKRAKMLLRDLAKKYQCHLGLILVEEPPPKNEKEFRVYGSYKITVHFADFSKDRSGAND